MRSVLKPLLIITPLILMLTLTGCITPQPSNTNNICSIFRQYPKWYWATQNSARRWGVPVNVQMAIMHQESRFKGDAKPARTKLLWIIPWTRPSSSYGYTQALDQTWEHYKKSAGKHFVSRSNFSDAVDFIGWYGYTAHRKLGIPKNDAYKLYLAYHEGMGGYSRKTYLRKKWLIAVSRKVKRQATIYRSQLAACQGRLKSEPWYRKVF